MMYCPYCGKKIINTFTYCGFCGKKIPTLKKVTKNSSKRQNSELLLEEKIGVIQSTNECNILIRIIKFDDSDKLIDIRKISNKGAKLNGLSFDYNSLNEFNKIMEQFDYNYDTGNFILSEELYDKLEYENYETEDGKFAKTARLDHMKWNENQDIQFNLLIFADEKIYLDIRKYNNKKNKRAMGISIRVDLIPEFKRLMSKINDDLNSNINNV